MQQAAAELLPLLMIRVWAWFIACVGKTNDFAVAARDKANARHAAIAVAEGRILRRPIMHAMGHTLAFLWGGRRRMKKDTPLRSCAYIDSEVPRAVGMYL